MPSITYIDENGTDSKLDDRKPEIERESPEPPTRYDASKTPPLPPQGSPSQSTADFTSTRRLVTIAQILAIVSLLIGGVLVSSIALIVAVVAFGRTKSHLNDREPEIVTWQLLKRSATIAIVVAILALAANIAALMFIYPMVIEALQTGEYSSLISGSIQMPGSASTSTWG